jgi:hypothetical protein
MPASPPLHRLNLALLLLLAVGALLLALPTASLARTHKASCHATHAKRATRKCSTAARKTKSLHGAHAGKPANKPVKPSAQASLTPEESGEAKCEDGSAAITSGEGLFSCDDGSEPSCPTGLTAIPSSDGSNLLCEAIPAEGEEEPEAEEA